MKDNTSLRNETNNSQDDQKSTQQQLADAHKAIDELKMQIAWMERSYE